MGAIRYQAGRVADIVFATGVSLSAAVLSTTALVPIVPVLMPQPAWAEDAPVKDYIWRGDIDSLWSNATNWTEGMIPDAGGNVFAFTRGAPALVVDSVIPHAFGQFGIGNRSGADNSAIIAESGHLNVGSLRLGTTTGRGKGKGILTVAGQLDVRGDADLGGAQGTALRITGGATTVQGVLRLAEGVALEVSDGAAVSLGSLVISADSSGVSLNAGSLAVGLLAGGQAGAGGDIVFSAGQAQPQILTVTATDPDGFRGRIAGSGTFVVEANSSEVRLIGNESAIARAEVRSGVLRIDSETLSGAEGAPSVVMNGLLAADVLMVEGTPVRRAFLAGSGTVAAPVGVGAHGALLGDQPGTLKIDGSLDLRSGASLDVSGFAAGERTDNPFFHVSGTVTAHGDNRVNLGDATLDPGTYKILTSGQLIAGSEHFSLGAVPDEESRAGLRLVMLDGGMGLGLQATHARTQLRFLDGADWNGDWVDADGNARGGLQGEVEQPVLGVIGHDGFSPAAEIALLSPAPLSQGLEFNGSRRVNGEAFVLNGGAAGTDYENWSTLAVRDGTVAVSNRIEGDKGLRVTGNGVLQLLNESNAYEGGTHVSNATVRVEHDGALGKAASGVTLDNAGLDLQAGFAATERPLDIGGHSTLSLGGDVVFKAPVSEAAPGAVLELTGGKATVSTLQMAGSSITIAEGAELEVQDKAASRIGTAVVHGSLFGTLGQTMVVDNLALKPTALVTVDGLSSVSRATAGSLLAPAFSGAGSARFEQGSRLRLAETDGFTLASGSELTLTIFDYGSNVSGTLALDEETISRLRAGNAASAEIKAGRLVLKGQTAQPGPGTGETPEPTPGRPEPQEPPGPGGTEPKPLPESEPTPGDEPVKPGAGAPAPVKLTAPQESAPEKTPPGTSIPPVEQIPARFDGDANGGPALVKGIVPIGGLSINGKGYVFQDGGNRDGVFDLQATDGSGKVTLTVAGDGSAVIAIPVGGDDFRKTGTGELVLAGSKGVWSRTNTGTIEEGRLTVTGNFIGTDFVVTGGTLAADGRMSNVTVDGGAARINGQALAVTVNRHGSLEGKADSLLSGEVNVAALRVLGGTFRPGNSPGTMRLGSYMQYGGVLEIERGDMIEVRAGYGHTVGGDANEGRARFSRDQGEAVALRLLQSESIVYGRPQAFLYATAGVTGAYDAIRVVATRSDGRLDERLFSRFAANSFDDYGRLTPGGRYGAAYLERYRSFASVTGGGNETAVARSLDALAGDAHSTVNPIVDMLASARADQLADARATFSLLSGELHASLQGVLLEGSRHLREATASRLRSAMTRGKDAAAGQFVRQPAGTDVTFWGRAQAAWGHSGSGSSAALSSSSGGFLLGADVGVGETLRLGFAGGYGRSEVAANALFSKATVDQYHATLYAGGQIGALNLTAGLGHSWHGNEVKRNIVMSGFELREQLYTAYDARTLQLYGEAGYGLETAYGALEPFINLAFINQRADGFQESENNSGLNAAQGQSMNTAFSTFGVRVSRHFDLSGARGSVRGQIGWRHAFGDIVPTMDLAGRGLGRFTVTGAPIARDMAVLGLELDVEVAAGAMLGLNYNGQLGNDTREHGLRGQFAVTF